MDEATEGLAALEKDIRRDFGYLNYPPVNWVKGVSGPTGEKVLDVAIIGGGMCGLAAAFGLTREGIRNFRIFDQSPANTEGPWVTTARMRTLRSPKHLTGPHMGLPNLTFQAWFRSQWDSEAWEALGHIPREMWMDYLRWYRRILDIPVENEIRLERIEPEGELLRLYLTGPAGNFDLLARHLVLATGRAAFGGTRRPEVFNTIPESHLAHTEDNIDFAALRDKRVLVIGGAASAVDSAAVALETGAREVHLLMRSPEIPRINKFKSTVYPGFLRGFYDLPDALRWDFLRHGLKARVAAPRGSMLRLKEHDNFHIHCDCEIERAEMEGEAVRIQTTKGPFEGDFLILGTGYAIDIGRQPELEAFAEKVLLWRDKYTPPADQEFEELGGYPYLGAGFELLEKAPGVAPYLKRIHLFNAATTLSHAPVSSDIPGVNVGAERLVDALVKDLFVAGGAQHLDDFHAYADPELLGDEWR